jgi:hypothetical protein
MYRAWGLVKDLPLCEIAFGFAGELRPNGSFQNVSNDEASVAMARRTAARRIRDLGNGDGGSIESDIRSSPMH